MFETIILATDLSPASNILAGCANCFQRLGAKKVFLVYAMGIRHLEEMKYFIQEKVEPMLQGQKKTLSDFGLDVEIELRTGVPSEEIQRVADEKNASLIVIGSHGQSMAQHMLFKFGGTASEVLHSFRRPLLLIKTRPIAKEMGTCPDASHPDILRKILYCTDFSDTAQRAFDHLQDMAGGGARQVTLLHVQDKTKIEKHLAGRLDEFNKIDADRLAMLKERLGKRGAKDIAIKIPYGIPTAEILAELAAGAYSLVIMGSQGRGFFGEIFLGSVSHNLARMAEVPLLLIPAIR